jgi:predicted class III extradiol MEMO1 family dioxygenase
MRRPSVDEARSLLEQQARPRESNTPVALLVPHADPLYSGACAAAAFVQLARIPSLPVLLTGTWHNPRANAISSTPADTDREHSIYINEAFLRAAGMTRVTKVLFAPDVPIADVVTRLQEWKRDNPSGVLVVSVDFTHQGTNPSAVAQFERRVIRTLEQGSCAALDQELARQHTIDGPLLLRALCSLVKTLNWQGKLLCHVNSAKAGWDQTGSAPFVSYVSMAFYKPAEAAANGRRAAFPVTAEQDAELLNFTKALLARRPAELSVQNPYNQFSNGVFLGLVNKRGQTFASIGRFEAAGGSIVDKIKSIVPNLIADANSQRLNVAFDKDDMTRVEIKLLAKEAHWRPFDEKVQRQDNYGFFMRFDGRDNVSAVFLPSVWQERPAWSLTDLLQHLALKAGRTLKDPYDVRLFCVVHTVA